MHIAVAIFTYGYAFITVIADLAAPTRVSPAPATEQKQHQDNDQDSFQVAPHL